MNMTEGINVLSLFDGMSCGQIALQRAGIKVKNYFASEIDKYAIKVTQENYPNTIQLGDVKNINVQNLPKIDLLIGGSPCQCFSFAGKRKGMSTTNNIEILSLDTYLSLKEQGYEFEGQSYLFWEYVRVLKELKPKYFFLENVLMEDKWKKLISRTLGVNPIQINSSLVSAQNRNRLYWTNIGLKPAGLFDDLESTISQPKDKGILITDILEDEVDDKYFLSELTISRMLRNGNDDFENEKSICIEAGYYKQGKHIQCVVHNTQPRYADRPSLKYSSGGSGPLSRNDGKTYCLDTGNTNAIQIVSMRTNKELEDDYKQELLFRKNLKTNCLTTVEKDNLVLLCGDYRVDDGFRWRNNKKSPTLMDRSREDASGQPLLKIEKENINNCFPKIRRLTPKECERLQTINDNYTSCVSDSQRYKMLGNGWTADVIAHIFSYLNEYKTN
jgi:DNA (cytosine-5)-methyltransferase 3A